MHTVQDAQKICSAVPETRIAIRASEEGDSESYVWPCVLSMKVREIFVTLLPQDRKIALKGKLGFRLPVLAASGPRVSGLA